MFYCFKVLNYIKCRENSDNVENLDAVINDHIGFGNALLNRTQSMFPGADGTDPRGGTCLQWCRAGLGTAGGCLSNYSTSSHCDNQNHFCTFLNTVVDPPSGKWTIWIYRYVGDMGTLAMHCILSSSLRIHSIANRRDGSIKGYHWH